MLILQHKTKIKDKQKMDKGKWNIVLGSWYMLLVALMSVNCSSCKSDASDEMFANLGKEEKVDISDIIDIYKKCAEGHSDSFDYQDVLFKGCEELHEDDMYVFQADADYLLKLPEFDSADNEEIKKFVDWYNCGIILNNMNSDLELGWREICSSADVEDAIRKYDTKQFYSDGMRSMMTGMQRKIMDKANEGEDSILSESITEYMFEVMADAEEYVPFDYVTDSAAVAMLIEQADSVKKCYCREKIDSLWNKGAKEDECVSIFLNAIQEAASFDEQCALLCGWANNENSDYEQDAWIPAVAYRLMCADKYSPFLEMVWGIWRCTYQKAYGGMSRDSSIPNEAYNLMRRRVFTTALRYAAKNPADQYARFMMLDIVSDPNLNRFGEFMFGNQTPIEEMKYMYERLRYLFKSGNNGSESEDLDE